MILLYVSHLIVFTIFYYCTLTYSCSNSEQNTSITPITPFNSPTIYSKPNKHKVKTPTFIDELDEFDVIHV